MYYLLKTRNSVVSIWSSSDKTSEVQQKPFYLRAYEKHIPIFNDFPEFENFAQINSILSNLFRIFAHTSNKILMKVVVNNLSTGIQRSFLCHPLWLSPYNQVNPTIFDTGKTLPWEEEGERKKYVLYLIKNMLHLQEREWERERELSQNITLPFFST